MTLACCNAAQNGSSNLSCFISLPTSGLPSTQHCLPPLTILNANSEKALPASSRRCSAASDCSETSLCVLSKAKGSVLRIQFLVPDATLPGVGHNDLDAHLKTIVWSGPKEEILEDGELLPKVIAFGVDSILCKVMCLGRIWQFYKL